MNQPWGFQWPNIIPVDRATAKANGAGRAYGLEMNIKTSRKKANGQLGYTFSRAQRQIAGINRGRYYPSNFDKPHILNLVVNLLPSIRHNVTFS